MAVVAKLHSATQPPIPLKPFIKYHNYPNTRVTTQFETPTGIGTDTNTVTRKQVHREEKQSHCTWYQCTARLKSIHTWL